MELHVKLAVASVSAFIFIIIFGCFAFPALMKFGIKHQMTLTKGNELRDMWSNLPFSIDFKIYLFNVTNARDVENGDLPMLDEIGPFVFEEWKSKVNLVDNETDDTVSFNAKTRWYFNQERSGKLTGDEIITIPHPLIMSMLLRTYEEKPPMIPMALKAVNGIFDNPTSMFLTVRVMDLLFDGIYINCNRSEFIPHAACFEMKQEKTLKKLPNDGLLFSFFGYKNSSLEETMKVKRGTENSLDLNKVVEFNNKTVMKIWPTNECNKIKGTESSVYHPLLEEKETLYGYVPLLCRELKIVYDKPVEFKGFNTIEYTTTFGDMTNNPDEKCYCPTKNYCLKKGAADLSKCSGAPIVATFPHFYDADEAYLESVRGLRPDEDKHKSKFYFEPFTGVILGAMNKLQFSFQLRRMENVTIMQKVPESMLPVLWLEEAVVLNSTYLNNLDKQVFLIFRINTGIKWTVLSLSIIGMITSLYMFMNKKRGFSLGNGFPKIASDDIKDSKSTIISSLSNMVNKDGNNK